MAIKTFIFKNTTDGYFSIDDLSGVRLPASGTVDVTDMFTNYTIYESLDLKSAISGTQIIVNNGTNDLDVEDGLIYCSYETPVEDLPGLHYDIDNGTYSIVIDGVAYEPVTTFTKLTDTPTTYSGEAGKYLRVLTTESGIEFVDPSEVDGIAGHDNANSEDESSTTNTNFQQKLRLSSTTDAGTYIVMWYYEWRYKDGNFEFKAQLQIDDTTILMDHNEQPTKISSWAPATGFKRVSLTGASHDIDLDYCSSKNGKEALIRRARLELWRI